MKKIWHHYEKWEEYKSGMWRKVDKLQEEKYFEWAIGFTGNTNLYGSWMMKVIKEWPISCQQNLSDVSLNRQAWIGHAACCLANSCPEYIVRRAWWELTEEQRCEANVKADIAIAEWEKNFRETVDVENRSGDQLSFCF
jgi:hypothetical protein